jgi:hypothetical protein
MTEIKKRKGLRKSINDKCKECCYHPDNGGGSWRQQVEACTVTSCALWEVRPKSVVRTLLEDEEEMDNE